MTLLEILQLNKHNATGIKYDFLNNPTAAMRETTVDLNVLVVSFLGCARRKGSIRIMLERTLMLQTPGQLCVTCYNNAYTCAM
jgi:hypothetical protein